MEDKEIIEENSTQNREELKEEKEIAIKATFIAFIVVASLIMSFAMGIIVGELI